MWCSWSCLPQGSKEGDKEAPEEFPPRTPEEKQQFDEVLPHINLLYLSMTVLIVVDGSYMSRFWCVAAPHVLRANAAM